MKLKAKTQKNPFKNQFKKRSKVIKKKILIIIWENPNPFHMLEKTFIHLNQRKKLNRLSVRYSKKAPRRNILLLKINWI